MNNANSEPTAAPVPIRNAKPAAATDELARLKHELLQAEVRLAKARATAAGAEIDIKVLSARLKAHAR